MPDIQIHSVEDILQFRECYIEDIEIRPGAFIFTVETPDHKRYYLRFQASLTVVPHGPGALTNPGITIAVVPVDAAQE